MQKIANFLTIDRTKISHKKLLKKTLGLLFLALLIFTMVGEPVKAGSLWDDQEGMDTIGRDAWGEGGEPRDPRHIIARVIVVALTFLALIFLILILYAGFRWMTSQGNEEKIKEAKSQITNAIIGLIIILGAYGITTFVMECVLKAAGSSLWGC